MEWHKVFGAWGMWVKSKLLVCWGLRPRIQSTLSLWKLHLPQLLEPLHVILHGLRWVFLGPFSGIWCPGLHSPDLHALDLLLLWLRVSSEGQTDLLLVQHYVLRLVLIHQVPPIRRLNRILIRLYVLQRHRLCPRRQRPCHLLLQWRYHHRMIVRDLPPMINDSLPMQLLKHTAAALTVLMLRMILLHHAYLLRATCAAATHSLRYLLCQHAIILFIFFTWLLLLVVCKIYTFLLLF